MKTFLILLVLLFPSIASAEVYYLINVDGVVVAKQNAPANIDNLRKDNFTQVSSKDDIDLRVAELRNGKIVVHTPTAKEIKEAQDASVATENRRQAKESAKAKLKALNLTDIEVQAILGE